MSCWILPPWYWYRDGETLENPMDGSCNWIRQLAVSRCNLCRYYPEAVHTFQVSCSPCKQLLSYFIACHVRCKFSRVRGRYISTIFSKLWVDLPSLGLAPHTCLGFRHGTAGEQWGIRRLLFICCKYMSWRVEAGTLFDLLSAGLSAACCSAAFPAYLPSIPWNSPWSSQQSAILQSETHVHECATKLTC